MHKIWLIIKREYLTRVRKKTFIISTVLFPLLYLGLIFGSGYITANSGRKLNVAVIDSSGYFSQERVNKVNMTDSSSRLTLVNLPADSMEGRLRKLGYDAYLVIPSSVSLP